MEENKKKCLALLLLFKDEDRDECVRYRSYKKRRLQTNVIFRTRYTEGCFNTMIMRHLQNDPIKFKEYFRLSLEQFSYVLNLVENEIASEPTKMVQRPISPAEKLAVTLRYMATGKSFRSLSFSFRISHCNISQIVRQVLTCLCEKMVPISLPTVTKEKMKCIASDFYDLWDFPNCCGAIDGKHCRIICPDDSGSVFFNYKSFYSIVILALVDAKYRFVAIDVGSYGKEGDSGIFEKSNLKRVIPSVMPEDSALPGTNVTLPHVIVGDEAFRLTRNVMRPYPRSQCLADDNKHIFNKRLCRARRTVENAFGIMTQTFRVFYTPIAIKPETADLLITACCCLHNLLRSSNFRGDEHITLPSGNLLPIRRFGGNSTLEAFNVREQFKDYFCSREGNLKWFQ